MGKRAVILAVVAATLVPASAPAQSVDGESAVEQGLRDFLDGLAEEVGPALRDLEDLGQTMTPLLRDLQRSLGEVVDDLSQFEAPEVLPNGDIILRRKRPEAPEGPLPEPRPDGTIDL